MTPEQIEDTVLSLAVAHESNINLLTGISEGFALMFEQMKSLQSTIAELHEVNAAQLEVYKFMSARLRAAEVALAVNGIDPLAMHRFVIAEVAIADQRGASARDGLYKGTNDDD